MLLNFFQVLVALLWINSALSATCERGSRLISEAGGVSGIAGAAAPEGASSLAGVVGISDPNQTPPVQLISTIPGAPGILGFADFYAIIPTDNPNPILGGEYVQFPRTGSTNGVINRVDNIPFGFELPTAGTYFVLFQGTVANAGQLMLSLDVIQTLAPTVVGRATGNTQIVGFGLVTTEADHTLLAVINPPGNAPISLTPTAGGNNPVSAHLIIIKIQ